MKIRKEKGFEVLGNVLPSHKIEIHAPHSYKSCTAVLSASPPHLEATKHWSLKEQGSPQDQTLEKLS